MCGRAALTTSPSVLSSMRSTPWVDGCCGPMLRIISSVSRSSSPPPTCQSVLPVLMREVVVATLFLHVTIGRCEIERPDSDFFAAHGALGHLCRRLYAHAVVEIRVDPILAQRIADP